MLALVFLTELLSVDPKLGFSADLTPSADRRTPYGPYCYLLVQICDGWRLVAGRAIAAREKASRQHHDARN